MTPNKAAHLRVSLLTSALVVSALSSACDDEGMDGPRELDSSVGQLDSSMGLLDASMPEPYDPYWTDFDAAVDLVPATEPPAKQHAWADWTTFTVGEDGGATGALQINDAGVTLTYNGPLYNAQVKDGEIMYWQPGTAYKSAAVPNGPAGSDNIMLAGGENRIHTLTFSAPVTNPVLALMSLGSISTTTVCRFDDDFELLSHGPGFYGEGEPLKHLPDHVLAGRESSGAIRFQGTFTTIRWKSVISEPWYALTVGVPTP